VSSASRKGSRAERRVAGALGGRRSPLSGAVGGGDVWIPQASHWADWSVEVKARKRPSWSTVREALDQAEVAARGSRRRPLAVIVPDRAAPIACMRLEDLRAWADALAEIGTGSRLRALLRQARRVLDEIEEALR
jgi:hypothetical protein